MEGSGREWRRVEESRNKMKGSGGEWRGVEESGGECRRVGIK